MKKTFEAGYSAAIDEAVSKYEKLNQAYLIRTEVIKEIQQLKERNNEADKKTNV